MPPLISTFVGRTMAVGVLLAALATAHGADPNLASHHPGAPFLRGALRGAPRRHRGRDGSPDVEQRLLLSSLGPISPPW